MADYLSDGIYELRIGLRGVNYRILYFFHGRRVAIIAHALTKEARVPEKDLTIALRRKAAVEKDPKRHIRGLENR
jgi:phage-related protein